LPIHIMRKWFQRKQASRKYVDLIMYATSKWANWDPPNAIKAGDFGTIDPETGQFKREGNIYVHPETAAIAKKFPAETKKRESRFVAISKYSTELKGEASGNAKMPSANVAFSARVKFEKRRGAFLIMHKPRMVVVPNEVRRALLNGAPQLFEKGELVLVTETFCSDGYVLYMSDKKEETVNVTLRADISAAVAASAGGNVEGAWNLEGGSGLIREGYCPRGYTPLYSLERIESPGKRIRWRDGPDTDAADGDNWAKVEAPWDLLDSDGEEELEEVFSDAE